MSCLSLFNIMLRGYLLLPSMWILDPTEADISNDEIFLKGICFYGEIIYFEFDSFSYLLSTLSGVWLISPSVTLFYFFLKSPLMTSSFYFSIIPIFLSLFFPFSLFSLSNWLGNSKYFTYSVSEKFIKKYWSVLLLKM